MKEFRLLYWSRLATEIESTGYKHKERERTFKQVGSHSSGGLAPNSTRQPGWQAGDTEKSCDSNKSSQTRHKNHNKIQKWGNCDKRTLVNIEYI